MICLESNSVDDWVSGNSVVCNGVPGLTKEQRELCHRNPDVTVAAVKGLQMAISECQHQFMWHRWNCSSLTPSSRTQQSSVLFQRGEKNSPSSPYIHLINSNSPIQSHVTRAGIIIFLGLVDTVCYCSDILCLTKIGFNIYYTFIKIVMVRHLRSI